MPNQRSADKEPINLWVSKEMKEELDALIRARGYLNRSDVVAAALSEYLKRERQNNHERTGKTKQATKSQVQASTAAAKPKKPSTKRN